MASATPQDATSLNIDPRLQDTLHNIMRDSHERSTGAPGQPPQPGQPGDEVAANPANLPGGGNSMHDLAAVASTRVHVDPSSADAQAQLRQFQIADPEKYAQMLKSIPGALEHHQGDPMDPHGSPPTIIPHPHLPGYSYPPPGSIHHPPPMPGQPGVPPPQQPDMESMEGLEGQLHNGGPPQDGQQLQGDSGSGSSAQGSKGRRKKDQHSAEDWTRIRKDNHKEVERRRRGAINQGINELGLIVPNNGAGEKAKGAVLNRAVQYIRQLKENEARNIEKWTLEKLLMDQAMGDMQAQVEESRRRWEEERARVGLLEKELGEMRTKLASLEQTQAQGNQGNEGAPNGSGEGTTAEETKEDGVSAKKRQRTE